MALNRVSLNIRPRSFDSLEDRNRSRYLRFQVSEFGKVQANQVYTKSFSIAQYAVIE